MAYTLLPPETKYNHLYPAVINNNNSLLAEHPTESKENCFQHGLPYYACVDADNNIWTKELSSGHKVLVKLGYNFEKESMIEEFIRKII